MSADVLTRSYDSARTGANTAEAELTPHAVQTRGIKTLLTLTTPDDPRLEAQPLYVAGITVKGKTRDVIYQATMGNTVYAWDAATGEQLWKTNLGTPITGSPDIDAYNINVKWGVLSTPVIDRAANALVRLRLGQPRQHRQVADRPALRRRAGPGHRGVPAREAAVAAARGGVPAGAGRDEADVRQRGAEAAGRAWPSSTGPSSSALGTIAETAKSARGWMFCRRHGRVWEDRGRRGVRRPGAVAAASGCPAGPAVQERLVRIWVVTGNGDFDGKVDFSESVVRLRYTPAAPGWRRPSRSPAGGPRGPTPAGTGGNPGGEGPGNRQVAAAAHTAPMKGRPPESPARCHTRARMGVQASGHGRGVGRPGPRGQRDRADRVPGDRPGASGKDGAHPVHRPARQPPRRDGPRRPGPRRGPGELRQTGCPPADPVTTYFDPGIDPATPNPATLNLPGRQRDAPPARDAGGVGQRRARPDALLRW